MDSELIVVENEEVGSATVELGNGQEMVEEVVEEAVGGEESR